MWWWNQALAYWCVSVSLSVLSLSRSASCLCLYLCLGACLCCKNTSTDIACWQVQLLWQRACHARQDPTLQQLVSHVRSGLIKRIEYIVFLCPLSSFFRFLAPRFSTAHQQFLEGCVPLQSPKRAYCFVDYFNKLAWWWWWWWMLCATWTAIFSWTFLHP